MDKAKEDKAYINLAFSKVKMKEIKQKAEMIGLTAPPYLKMLIFKGMKDSTD